MNKTLLTGKKYVPAAETNLRATFQRIRKEQKESEERRKDVVRPIKAERRLG